MHKSKRFAFSKYQTMFAWRGCDYPSCCCCFRCEYIFFGQTFPLLSDNEFMRSLHRFASFYDRSAYFASECWANAPTRKAKWIKWDSLKEKLWNCFKQQKSSALKLDMCPLWSINSSYVHRNPNRTTSTKRPNEKSTETNNILIFINYVFFVFSFSFCGALVHIMHRDSALFTDGCTKTTTHSKQLWLFNVHCYTNSFGYEIFGTNELCTQGFSNKVSIFFLLFHCWSCIFLISFFIVRGFLFFFLVILWSSLLIVFVLCITHNTCLHIQDTPEKQVYFIYHFSMFTDEQQERILKFPWKIFSISAFFLQWFWLKFRFDKSYSPLAQK